jgi:hypothetical protein
VTSSRLALDARLGDCAAAPASLDNVGRSVGACPSRAQYARCHTRRRADYARRPSVRFDAFVGRPGSAVFWLDGGKGAVGVGPSCLAGSLTTTYSMCRRRVRSTSSRAAPAFALK